MLYHVTGGWNYRCVNCQMHEDGQCVDQPAQYQMVAAQQVKGRLRPSTKVFHYSFHMLYCIKTSALKGVQY